MANTTPARRRRALTFAIIGAVVAIAVIVGVLIVMPILTAPPLLPTPPPPSPST